MNQESVWREFAELPPEAQCQVVDSLPFCGRTLEELVLLGSLHRLI